MTQPERKTEFVLRVWPEEWTAEPTKYVFETRRAARKAARLLEPFGYSIDEEERPEFVDRPIPF